MSPNITLQASAFVSMLYSSRSAFPGSPGPLHNGKPAPHLQLLHFHNGCGKKGKNR